MADPHAAAALFDAPGSRRRPPRPPETGAEIAKAVPGARRIAIAQSGHLSALERPGEVNRALVQWLHDE
ncbi:hypothetical protein AB0I53_42030 [Saccharopolyspora sp. NPDC050389]|uniref:alpha/beta fold hydrolase n=1 Tax=Saccharopolyspora sp. NPDC050389 TaxID=3155516 RepID=UPI0033C1D250